MNVGIENYKKLKIKRISLSIEEKRCREQQLIVFAKIYYTSVSLLPSLFFWPIRGSLSGILIALWRDTF